jgi:hypothetical protein
VFSGNDDYILLDLTSRSCVVNTDLWTRGEACHSSSAADISVVGLSTGQGLPRGSYLLGEHDSVHDSKETWVGWNGFQHYLDYNAVAASNEEATHT